MVEAPMVTSTRPTPVGLRQCQARERYIGEPDEGQATTALPTRTPWMPSAPLAGSSTPNRLRGKPAVLVAQLV